MVRCLPQLLTSSCLHWMKMADFKTLSCESVCALLKEEVPGIGNEVLEKMREHKIDGEVFLDLNDEYLREIAPRLGERLKIKRVIATALAKKQMRDDDSPLPARCKLTSDSIAPKASNPDPSTSLSAQSCVARSLPLFEDDSDTEFYDDALGDDSSVQSSSAHEKEKCPVSPRNESSTGCDLQASGSSSEESSMFTKVQPASDWAEKLILPKNFQPGTVEAIRSGLMTRAARVDIINSLATLMMLSTMRPSPDDMHTVCRRLVNKYPTLKDSSPNCYSTWKEMLRTKFRNLRRPARAEKAGVTVPPPPKRFKKSSPTSTSPLQPSSTSDDAEYKRHIDFIKRNYHSKKWSQAGMLSLLKQTAKQRCKWIETESPSVREVLTDFPCLADPKIMVKTFCFQTGSNEEEFEACWKKCQEQILQYAPIEKKQAVKSILSDYHAVEDDNAGADVQTVFALLLLCALLCSRGKGQALFTVIEGESIDINEELEKMDSKAPCIVAFGDAISSATDFKVVVEKENIFPMPSLSAALHFCFSCYYVFNITFPPQYRFVLLFLEKYIYGLKPSQKLPLCVTVLHDSLEKILNTSN